MAIERKQHSAEFKRDAVRMITQGGKSASQGARTLGIHSNLLRKWKRQLALAQETQAAGRQGYEAFPGQGHVHDKELTQLRREVAALKMERDVLKKAIAIFAEPAPR